MQEVLVLFWILLGKVVSFGPALATLKWTLGLEPFFTKSQRVPITSQPVLGLFFPVSDSMWIPLFCSSVCVLASVQPHYYYLSPVGSGQVLLQQQKKDRCKPTALCQMSGETCQKWSIVPTTEADPIVSSLWEWNAVSSSVQTGLFSLVTPMLRYMVRLPLLVIDGICYLHDNNNVKLLEDFK